MKKIFLISFVIISSVCIGQKKDSVQVKQDSVTTVVSDLARFAYDKISAKDFDMLKGLLQAYLQQHEATKPKKIIEPKK